MGLYNPSSIGNIKCFMLLKQGDIIGKALFFSRKWKAPSTSKRLEELFTVGESLTYSTALPKVYGSTGKEELTCFISPYFQSAT